LYRTKPESSGFCDASSMSYSKDSRLVFVFCSVTAVVFWQQITGRKGGKGARRPVSRVLSSLAAWTAIPLGRASRHASRDQPGRRGGNALAAWLSPSAGRPYSVLLPVGFAVPPPLPGARCALAAPFHPCPRGMVSLRGRSVLCGTFPGVAPAGRWPAPYSRGARTFLHRGCPRQRPSSRLAGIQMRV